METAFKSCSYTRFCLSVCDYCSKNTYASVAAHTDDGMRQVQVGGNTTNPIMAERPWKKN